MKNEIWKKVVGFEDHYEVSSEGNVRSIARSYDQAHPRNKDMRLAYTLPGKTLAATIDGLGRKTVTLSKNSRIKPRRVHQLVAEAFLGYVPNGTSKGLVVDHKDTNPSNNALDNLQVIDQRLNIARSRQRELPTGVQMRNRKTPYKASIKISGKETYIGSFHTVEEASRAYQLKAAELTSQHFIQVTTPP